MWATGQSQGTGRTKVEERDLLTEADEAVRRSDVYRGIPVCYVLVCLDRAFYVAQASLKFSILLPQPPESSDYRQVCATVIAACDCPHPLSLGNKEFSVIWPRVGESAWHDPCERFWILPPHLRIWSQTHRYKPLFKSLSDTISTGSKKGKVPKSEKSRSLPVISIHTAGTQTLKMEMKWLKTRDELALVGSTNDSIASLPSACLSLHFKAISDLLFVRVRKLHHFLKRVLTKVPPSVPPWEMTSFLQVRRWSMPTYQGDVLP